jgi:DNA-3-methyladenine glycosylase
MQTGAPLRRAFFARPCLQVAPELIGAYLVHRLEDGTRLVGRIVEVEAYLGDGSDPGSHSHRGPSPRNRAMFGPPGRLYVYRSYGIHACANVVCEAEGRGAAVLLRAFEPVLGAARMRAERRLPEHAPPRQIASGPGKLTQALSLGLHDDGRSLLSGRLRLHRPARDDAPAAVSTSRRIGLGRGRELPYRFFLVDSPCLSRTRPG